MARRRGVRLIMFRHGLAGTAGFGSLWCVLVLLVKGRYVLAGRLKIFREVMTMETYSWRTGVQFPVKAEVAADAIKNLQASLGKQTITAKELLDASRDENAPLHDCFEWDDSIAAEKFRQDQARKIIIGIEVTKSETIPTTMRLFVNVVPTAARKQGEYATIFQAMVVDDWRKQVLMDALKELRSFQRKYSVYKELADVCTAIEAFADKLK